MNKVKVNHSFLFLFLICFSTLFMCIGYASINSITSEISGELIATPQEGVFITDIVYNGDSNADLVNTSINNFYQTMLDSKISLSSTNPNSYITYTVTVYNNSPYEYAYVGDKYGDDFYDNSNITFSVSEIEKGNKIASNEWKTFSITFSYLDKNNIANNILNSCINFVFERVYEVSYIDIVNDDYPEEAIEGQPFSVSFPYVNANYIEVKMNDTLLTLNNEFSYDLSTKTLTIFEVTGDIEITYNYIPIIDLTGNDALVPVWYNGERWKVANPDRGGWYDYDNQQWANAVILVENEREIKEAGDSVSLSSDNLEAMAMFVWIPRFEYKIENTYGIHTDGTAGIAAAPGEIDVNFIPSEQITASKGYKIHPAFTFGGKNLSGIWVGKFETGHSSLSSSTTENNLGCTNEKCSNADGIVILPNVSPLTYNSVSNFFYAARSMSRSGNAFGIDSSLMDTHMMKNSEWGAVAYLSQSKYGKYGNVNYTGVNKEIYQNKSLITGNSNGTPSQDTTNTQCSYDDLTDRGSGTGSCGGGASTTGNIYGIYDFSGSANEYVMGYLTTSSSTWGATSSANSAGFSSQPNAKYFDGYNSTTSSVACNSVVCYGHALDETAAWYGDSVNFINEGSPWLLRGGAYNRGTITGMFYYSRTAGLGSSSRAFRVVISNS